ncbi:MAG: hypothetical protein GXO64_00915, partial [Candidatus Micrarchaeota archaeon]|nr:hypothetical protein [Candidatus Micrarchaeota archaeon]
MRFDAYVALFVVVVSATSFISTAHGAFAAGCTVPLPADGKNWTIDDLVICSDMVIEITGNITVNKDSVLDLNNVTLLINASKDGQFVIDNKGVMDISSSIIKSNGSGKYLFRSSGSLTILNSTISDCGMTSNKMDNLGLYVKSNDFTISDSTLKDSFVPLIVLGDDAKVINNRFDRNQRQPRLDGEKINFSSNTISNSPGNLSIYGNQFFVFNNTLLSGENVFLKGNEGKFDSNNIDGVKRLYL